MYINEPGFSGSMGGPDGFSIIFFLVFALIIGAFIFMIISGLTQWTKNNNSPRVSVPAEVKTKRTDTRGGSGESSAHTSYYVTFEAASGDRMELQVSGTDFGLIAEEDMGLLTFQGTRFIAFERKRD